MDETERFLKDNYPNYSNIEFEPFRSYVGDDYEDYEMIFFGKRPETDNEMQRRLESEKRQQEQFQEQTQMRNDFENYVDSLSKEELAKLIKEHKVLFRPPN